MGSNISGVLPAIHPYQGNESDVSQVRLLQTPVLSFGYFDEVLNPARIANRHDNAAAGSELIDERLRDMTSARSSEDRTKGRLIYAAPRAVALKDRDIVVTEAPEPLARRFDEVMVALDANDLRRDATDDCSRVSRAGTDLEHLIARQDAGGLDHQCDDVRLRDRLTRFDRQRMVTISEVRVLGADELLARGPAETRRGSVH